MSIVTPTFERAIAVADIWFARRAKGVSSEKLETISKIIQRIGSRLSGDQSFALGHYIFSKDLVEKIQRGTNGGSQEIH